MAVSRHRKINNKYAHKDKPLVSILIAAHNEERHIEETINNKLSQDYPSDKIEVIVISDGSTDRTDIIVNNLTDPRVRLIRQEPRGGKTAALNTAVSIANGDILVFSDANSLYAPDALRKLIECFTNPNVGYVTGKMIYTNPDGSQVGDGCSTYMRLENKLRDSETKLGSIVGVDGGIDAMREELYSPLNPDQLPDFVQPLKVVEKGYRVVYQPNAILKESALNSMHDEYRMRVRVSLRAFWALYDMRRLLFGGAGALFTWQLWSHKALRYLCFLFLILCFSANLLLIHEHFLFLILFILQSIFYLLAFLGHLLEIANIKSRILYVFHYFVLLNIASAHAFVKFIMGHKLTTWTPRKG